MGLLQGSGWMEETLSDMDDTEDSPSAFGWFHLTRLPFRM